MWAVPWGEMLVGRGGESWRTVAQQRSVLVVVHTVTAATRLLDVLPLWTGDHRVQTAFTCPRTSAFTAGTEEFLRARGVEPIPWEDALGQHFNLAVAASYGGPLHELSAPLIILPHGMGYNKYAPGNSGTRELGNSGTRELGNSGTRELGNSGTREVFGLSGPSLLHDGQLVPSVAVLSHTEQRDRLHQHCPEAVGAALVAGDPCFDRMLAGRPLRESYRRRFGVHCGQKLVVISSTWGGDSLFARDPDLVPRLARRLPLDEYRLVVALHPNIWYAHTPWQVRNWTAHWQRAGAVVLPPEEGWRAALVAADLTIGDHGSVTFYSAALGNPLVLAAAPLAAVDDGSPIARLLRSAPQLDPAADPREQIDAAISEHDPAQYADITAHTTSYPGESARLLRSSVYEQLALAEPEEPGESAAPPLPEIADAGPSSQIVHVEPDAGGASATRLPADALRERDLPPADWVLVTSTDEPARRWLECAEILLHDERLPDPQRWIRTTTAGLTGAVLAATRDQSGCWVAGGPDIPVVRFSGPDDLVPVLTAYLRARTTSGEPVEPGSVRLCLGPREARFEIE